MFDVITSNPGTGIAEIAFCSKEGEVLSAPGKFKDITPDEIKALYAEPEGPEGPEGPRNGSIVTLAGVKAMVLQTDDINDVKLMTLVTMKTTETDESRPLVIGFCSNFLIIGLSEPGYRTVGVRVERLTSHLKNHRC